MEFYELYCSEMPEFLTELAGTKEMLRLKEVGMDCGCEYTAFPAFLNKSQANRYDHSLGVALIVWNFTHNPTQSIAGLFHDIATPAFSHVIDFLDGDHEKQESTEEKTAEMIMNSAEIQKLLLKYGIDPEKVVDYHDYPIADNDLPRLSADRLEYTLKNLTRYGRCSTADVRRYYADLTVAINEFEEEELMFSTEEICREFVKESLPVFVLYSSDTDRFIMETWARILKKAVSKSLLTREDFYKSEKHIISVIQNDDELKKELEYLTSAKRIVRSAQPLDSEYWLKVSAKKRYLNPMVKEKGRACDLFPDFKKDLDEYLASGFDYWICAE